MLDLKRCFTTRTCFTEDESTLLASGVPGVERDGAQLRIRQANGSTSVFTNTRGQGGGGWATYRYLGYVPEIAQHLLSVNYYEGGDYILLAAEDGAATIVWTLPTLAPDVNHLAAVGAVPFSGTDTLRIQIWRREQDAFAAQHSLDIEHMGDFVMGYQAVPEWTSADTLEIRAVDQDGRDAGLGVVTI